VSARLATTIALYAGFVAAWLALAAVAGRGRDVPLVAGLVILELAALVQAAIATAAVVSGREPGEPGVFAGYLVASLAIVPGAAAYAPGRSRSDLVVLAMACVALAVVSWRMTVTWGSG
jgi:hypothetical protein